MQSEVDRLLSHLKGEITKAKKAGWAFPAEFNVSDIAKTISKKGKSPKAYVEEVRNKVYEGIVSKPVQGAVATSLKEYKELQKEVKAAKRRKGYTPPTPPPEPPKEPPLDDAAISQADVFLERLYQALNDFDKLKTADNQYRPSVTTNNFNEAQAPFTTAKQKMLAMLGKAIVSLGKAGYAKFILNHQQQISDAVYELDYARYEAQIKGAVSHLAALINTEPLSLADNEELTELLSNDLGYEYDEEYDE